MKRTLGVCEWALPVKGATLFKELKSLGIDTFQLDTGAYEEGIPTIFPEVQQSYLEGAQEAGIELCCAGNMSLGSYGMVHPAGSPKYDACREIISRSLTAMEAMKIPILMCQSFFDGEITDEDSLKNTAGMLKWACQLAADKGIQISTENALTVEDNLRLLEMVDQPNFGIGFDTQNPHGFKGYYVPDIIRPLVKYVNMLHIKDGVGPALGMALYGDGDSGFHETINIIKESGFDGCIISENLYKRRAFYEKAGGDPFTAIKEDVRRFNLIFAE